MADQEVFATRANMNAAAIKDLINNFRARRSWSLEGGCRSDTTVERHCRGGGTRYRGALQGHARNARRVRGGELCCSAKTRARKAPNVSAVMRLGPHDAGRQHPEDVEAADFLLDRGGKKNGGLGHNGPDLAIIPTAQLLPWAKTLLRQAKQKTGAT